MPSLEQFFGFFEKALADRALLAIAQGSKFLEFGLLRRRHMRRNLDGDTDVQVPMSIALDVFNPFPPEPKHCAGLSPRRDFDRSFAVKGGHINFSAQGGLHEVDRHLAKQIVAITLEDFVRADVEHDIEIARRSASPPGLTITG